MDKADAVGVEVVVQRRLVHQITDGVMGDEQSIEFLEHTNWLQAAQRAPRQPLVRVDFIDYQFDLPPLVVGASQVDGWIARSIEKETNTYRRCVFLR